MKVSIIVPVYKVEKYIERCARSLFEQTYEDLEYIFVDDCSPDNSIAILNRVVEDYPQRQQQVHIIRHEKNTGQSGARNTGIKAAAGDYIFFLDSDDEVSRDCIQKMTAPLKQKHYDFVTANFQPIGYHIDLLLLKLEEGEYSGDQVLETYCRGCWYVMPWNKLLNREFILRNELFFCQGIIYEDELWAYQLACCAKSMYALRDVTVKYYKNEGSTMTSVTLKKNMHYYLIVLQKLHAYMKEHGICGAMYEWPLERIEWRVQEGLEKLGYSSYQIYETLRKTDNKNLSEKISTCFKGGLHPFYLHLLLPARLGYLYLKAYSNVKHTPMRL